MFLSKHHSFGSSGFKCSGPSIAVEKMIWGAMKEVCRPLGVRWQLQIVFKLSMV